MKRCLIVILLFGCGTQDHSNDLVSINDQGFGETLATEILNDASTDTADDFIEIEDVAPDIHEVPIQPDNEFSDSEGQDVQCKGPSDCTSGLCHPEKGICVECITSADCKQGEYCDAYSCVKWVCVPGAKSCEGTYLLTCTWDGNGYEYYVDCDDHNACTIGDACVVNKCAETFPLDCDDHDQCTIDLCDPNSGCLHMPGDGMPCDDMDLCTLSDTCIAGSCIGTAFMDCNDGNECTLDTCTSLFGCYYKTIDSQCDDGNPCTYNDRCFLGLCRGDPVSCDDGNPCTLDSCDPLTAQCLHKIVCRSCENGCDDNDSCTYDFCDNGFCSYQVIVGNGCCASDEDCDDQNECTTDSCSPTHRCIYSPTPEPSCCVPVILTETFEPTTSFMLDPTAGDVGWYVVPTSRSSSPPNALYFGNPSTLNYDNKAIPSGEAKSKWLTLPAGVKLELKFLTWQDVEVSPFLDVLTVFARSQGEQWMLWRKPDNLPMKTVVPINIDITGLGGRTIQLVFSFDAYDTNANNGEGIYIDDVSITSPCVPKTCKVGLDCTSVGIHAWCNDGKCDFIQSYEIIRTFGASGAMPGQFSTPSDIAVSPDGVLVFVSDRKNNRVQIFDSSGAFVSSFGTAGSGPGQMNEPRGIAVSSDRVLVADTKNNRVLVFTPAGVFLFAFGNNGPKETRLLQPKGVAIAPLGKFIVADTGNHRVAVFSPDGGFLFSFGQYGKSDGNFRSPSCVTTGPDDTIWVCDTTNQRIQVFKPDGTWQMSIKPPIPDFLNNPYGASVRWDGILAVADTSNHRVLLFGSDGTLLDSFGSLGEAQGEFKYPLGVAWTPDGSLFIADSENDRIVVLGQRH